MAGASFDAAVESIAEEKQGDAPPTPDTDRLSATAIPTHRDETLVGRSDKEDIDAARAATAAGVDAVSDYMKRRLNRQFM